MTSEFQRLQEYWGVWADGVFQHDGNPIPALHHLKKEVDEIIQDPTDVMEYADALALLLVAAREVEIYADDILQAAREKLEINKKRVWGEPDEDGVREHVRGE